MLISPLTMEDIDKVLSLERNLYPDPWTRDMFLQEIFENKYAYMFVAKEQNQLIGYYGFWAVDDEAMVTKISIVKPLQKLGIGRILFEDMLKRIKVLGCLKITLEVRISNARAINLYEKNGFLKVGTRKQYYKNGEDAYTMVKEQ